MFTSKKIQTVGTIKEFLNPSPVKESTEVITGQEGMPFVFGAMLPVFFTMQPSMSFAATTATASASVKEEVSRKVIDAFNPLTELVQGLSYPLAFLAFSAAGIYWLLGNRPKALEMMQGATIGYIIVQLSPMLMRLLVSVTAGF
ncbi:hypothetical protein ICR95_21010 [Priestia megaterium]|uniref:hypothetical protein n=1 Tax=Priestia megaterium TaxID=1404 RepID=UPI00196A7C63|nr:hypothetical protein [Priestia megaterium]QSF32550.1 hypothetical protein ICR95_21010 [Priestia megaterium]